MVNQKRYTAVLVLAVALLAGCAVPVGAEPESGSGVYLEGRPCLTSVDDLGKTFARCFLPGMKGDLIVDVLPNPCLAKMEAAMRAMEPYFLMKEKDYQAWAYYEVNIFQGVKEQWESAKRACWRNP